MKLASEIDHNVPFPFCRWWFHKLKPESHSLFTSRGVQTIQCAKKKWQDSATVKQANFGWHQGCVSPPLHKRRDHAVFLLCYGLVWNLRFPTCVDLGILSMSCCWMFAPKGAPMIISLVRLLRSQDAADSLFRSIWAKWGKTMAMVIWKKDQGNSINTQNRS